MGIQGLLPLLSSIQQPISLSELSGSTVGVDVYCWLHKGAYGCALELAEGNDSDVYIKYVMRRVNMMLYYKVKPILVFDGGYLPSKGEKEAERRQRRKQNKSQGLDHLKKGNRTQALEYFQKSIDITPEMALNVMKACREKGVNCIVAPYEADAQLAYLMKTGITQCTISEDSDLLVFGCDRVIFKMDANGSGLMIDLKDLPNVKVPRMDGFTQQKFREMCMLSGCDYLQSVKGMGLITAHKMVKKHSTVRKVISTLRLNTKMNVPKDYETRFEKAEQTFLYQVVFDPNTNKLVPLNPLPDDIDPVHLFFAGHGLKWKQEDALDLAIGNLNPLTGTKIGNFKLSKALSLDEHENDTTSRKENKSSKTSICPQVKKSVKSQHSVLSSNKTYEAERNLNGAFRDTTSSEKANNQFVTPVKGKRSRTKSDDTDERKQESSKLARLYSTSMAEVTVDVSFETTETTSESAPQFRTSVQPQPRKMRNNPFRSPVIRNPKCEQVVSRYFGLSGMEVEKSEMFWASVDSTAKTNDECSFTGPEENTANETQMTDSQISNEQENNEFQESGYLSSSQPIENSPTDKQVDPEVSTKSPSLPTNSPPLPTDSPSLPTDSPPLSNTLTSFSSLRKYSTTPTSRNTTKRKPRGKKSTSNQISLDMFAYAKVRTAMTDESKTETITTSPKRSVLADRSPPNYKLDGEFNESQDDDIEDENKKENCRNILRKSANKVEDMPRLPSLVQNESKVEVNPPGINMAQPKTIGLRTKPTNGLGRCRAVGLSRRRNKDTASKTNNDTTAPLLTYFEFRGRDGSSHGITS